MQAHQSKHSIGGSTIREREGERERDVCVFFLNFVSFFTLGTRLRIDLCKKSDRTIAVSILEYNINSNSKSAERAKAFWFSEGRTK